MKMRAKANETVSRKVNEKVKMNHQGFSKRNERMNTKMTTKMMAKANKVLLKMNDNTTMKMKASIKVNETKSRKGN